MFGVTLVAYLTLLGALINLFFAMLWIALGGMGSAGTYVSPPISYWVVLVNSFLLSALALVVSVAILNRARYAWHLANFLWVFSALHYCLVASLIFAGENLMITFGLAISINAAFIVYFQSRSVRDHFLGQQKE